MNLKSCKTHFFSIGMSLFITAAGLAACLFSCAAPPRNFLRAENGYIVNGHGDTILLRGMGLGGWMLQEGYMFRLGFLGRQYRIRESIEELVGKAATDRFYDEWLANHTRKADIDSLAAWGFNSIRLPMHYNLYTLPVEKEPVPGRHTWLEKGFALTDSLLAWCRANRMYLILDLHAAPGGQGNDLNISDRDPEKPSLWESEANRAKTIALWRKLAERYANEEWIGGYDILNETNWGFSDSTDIHGINEKNNAPLRRLLVDITRAIREADTNHIIFIEGNGFANNYNGIFPKWDENLVLSFHKYGNFNTRESIRRFLDLRDEHNIPLWLGESGENSNTWFTEAIELCEKHGIGWAWWQSKKMGINNPLEIRQPEGYQKLVDYFKVQSSGFPVSDFGFPVSGSKLKAQNSGFKVLNEDGGSGRPGREETLRVLEQLVENLRIENNIFHKDVIDAMFRQVTSYETIPFTEHNVRAGSTIPAVDFDLGRQRAAYFDTDSANYRYTPGVNTTGNRGRTYRNDGVDIRAGENGCYVFHIEDGEWLQYTVDVREEGINQLRLLVAADSNRQRQLTGPTLPLQPGRSMQPGRAARSGQITIRIDDHTLTNPVTVPAAAGDTSWFTVPVNIPVLPPGKAVIRVQAPKGGFAFKSLGFGRQ